MTFKEVSQWKTGRYLENLISALRRSQYVIFDVTGGPAAGVVVEIGITSGLRKPHAFCWFGDKPLEQSGASQKFDPQVLPEELRRVDIKVLSSNDGHSREAFYNWFARTVHSPCMVQSEMCGFQGFDGDCSCLDIKSDRNKIYVWAQPRNMKLRDALVGELAKRGVAVLLPEEFGDNLSAKTCRLLRSVGGAIFDISRADGNRDFGGGGEAPSSGIRLNPRYAADSREVLPLLQVGYALGMGLSHACIYREEQGYIRSSMLPGKTSFAESAMSRAVEGFVDWFIGSHLDKG